MRNMSKQVYSAHPALASEQLQRAENSSSSSNSKSSRNRQRLNHNNNNNNSTNAFTSLSCSGSATPTNKNANRTSNVVAATLSAHNDNNNTTTNALSNTLHPSTMSATTTTTAATSADGSSSNNIAPAHTKLPNRIKFNVANDDDIDADGDIEDADVDDDDDVNANANANVNDDESCCNIKNTKDCVDFDISINSLPTNAAIIMGVDEVDHVQHRFTQRNHQQLAQPQQFQHHQKSSLHRCRQQSQQLQQPYQHEIAAAAAAAAVVAGGTIDGCISGLSSIISSPSASTVSSPLSTPTRLAPIATTATTSSSSSSSSSTQQQYHHHHHHHQLHHSHQHCCSKAVSASASTHQQQQQQLQHHRHHSYLPSSAFAQCPTIGSDAGGAGTGGGGGGNGSGSNSSSGNAGVVGGSSGSVVGSGSGSGSSGCKKPKLDPRLSPSPYRQLLPIALCILSFAAVFATLIVYMDTTEIRHQQFRLNMSRDYELNGVAQDDPALIAFLRQIHMRKYPMHFLKNRDADSAAVVGGGSGTASTVNSLNGGSGGSAGGGAGGQSASSSAEAHLNFSTHPDELAPAMAHYVADLVGGKMNGAVIQSLTGPLAHLITAPWLSETLNWMGIIVEPEPRWYFTLRKQNAQRARMQVVHACVSPNTYPKEVTIHNEEVRINSLHDEETSWFNSRVKCFPLYTIMLACDRLEYDLLSLGVHGHELEILQTLPFDKVKIDVISIHLIEDHEDVRSYVQSITKFLAGKSYKLQKKFGRNYFYQRLNSMSRTRKKDILLLKTP